MLPYESSPYHTDKGTIVVEVSPENDRKNAVSRLKEGLRNSYKNLAAKMIFPKLTVVGIQSDMQIDYVLSAICEKYELISKLITSGKTVEILKCRTIRRAIQKSCC